MPQMHEEQCDQQGFRGGDDQGDRGVERDRDPRSAAS